MIKFKFQIEETNLILKFVNWQCMSDLQWYPLSDHRRQRCQFTVKFKIVYFIQNRVIKQSHIFE